MTSNLVSWVGSQTTFDFDDIAGVRSSVRVWRTGSSCSSEQLSCTMLRDALINSSSIGDGSDDRENCRNVRSFRAWQAANTVFISSLSGDIPGINISSGSLRCRSVQAVLVNTANHIHFRIHHDVHVQAASMYISCRRRFNK